MSFSVKKQINSGKLRFLSSLSLSVIVVVIVFTLTNSVMNSSLQRAKQKYLESCYAVLDGYSNAVLFYLKNYKTSLESIYDERLLKSGDADKIQQWVKMNKPLLHKDFLRLFFIDKNGIAYIEDDMVIDVSQKEYFTEIKPVNKMINISNIFFTENEKSPVVVISIPYVNEKNEIVFVLAASMYVSSLRKIVDNIKIGGDCEMYLLDRHGRFLLNPNEALIGKTFTPSEERYSSVSTTYIASYERGYVETKNSKGELVDLFYTKLPESEWTFTVGFPRYTLTKIYNQENWERIAIIVISVLSILVLVFLQNKIINYFYQRQTIEIEYDSLTNLFTRQKFESIATKLIKQSPNQKFMLIESDIRGFKFINQNYGEEAADKLIYYYSTLINRTTKMYKGIVGRGYADHFYSLMKVKNVNSSMRKFKADLNNLLEVIKNYDIPFFPKFGIVFVRADSSKNISIRELVGQASFAKSSIKDTMTDFYAIYNSRIVNKMNEIRMIEQTAESALINEEFYVLYQPKILLANDKIVGAEALVRWKTKDGKFYTPDKFIPLFEQNGFITKLDFFVYEKVFQFLDKRIKNGENVVTISLNMSRNHNRPDKFMNEFMHIFNKYDIPAKYVQVEIIERSVMDETTLREITDRLHKNGFTVAMDDFGSGESSLNMLTKVPVDVLKFDRDFLLSSTKEDGSLTEKSEKFIQSLLELSRNLEKETVFEGVETESQRDFLKRAYCDQVQGYFYSKPLSEEDFVDFKKPVREWFSKMKNTTPFINDFLFRANLKSGIFVGILVSFLEIWLIIAAFAVKHDGTVAHDGFWLLTHICSYLFLFILAFSIFLYSTLYLLGYKFDKRIGYVIKVIFSIGSIIFALYITYFSYDKCGSAFAFMTIGIYIFCLFNWHPLANLIMTVVSFGIFFYLQYYKGELTYSIWINGFTAWLMLFISGVNVYMQRKSDAIREESLKELTEQLIEKNKTDALTGLHNVAHFNHAAEIILKSEFTDISKLCFVFVDIENFKNYNEKYGFKEGSAFLVKAGNIINEVFTDSLSARVSDDHFVILTKIDEVHEKLSQVRLRIKYEEESINLGIKAGIYTPKTRDYSPSLACDHARYACSSIKKNYAVTFIEYDESMNDDFKKKQYIINNIDNALMHAYIKVYYQPVVWAKDACLCGVEALSRWNDPNVGFLSPADFIPILEEYHMIHKLDMFILEEVCKDLSEANDPELPKLPVSINFSRLDFDHTDIFAEVERCVKKYGINKQMIHIEITESALHDSDEKFRKTLDMFRSNGYALWLDDFGSGYSGLNVLKEFNFDTMKIDMKFLYRFSENKKAQPILTSIVDLANKIGMNTLTEGVETEEVFNFLRSIGCQRLQGYFFGKPMPKEELAARIKAGKFVVDKK